MNNAALYVLTVAVWGGSWFGIKLQLGVVDPEASVVYRFALAALILFAWCAWRRLPLRFSAREHGYAALMGFFMLCLNYALFYYAAAELTSGLVALAFSLLILFNALFGVIFLRSRVRPRVVLGGLIGIAGIALVYWPELAGFGGGQATARGVAYAVIATIAVSLGNIVSARNQLAGMPVVQTNAYGMAYSALLMAAFAVAGGKTFGFDVSAVYIGSLAYLTVFASVVGFGCYLTLLGRIGADRAAYAMILHPIVALGISTVFEGFTWGWPALFGVGLALIGNVIVLGGGWRRARGSFTR